MSENSDIDIRESLIDAVSGAPPSGFKDKWDLTSQHKSTAATTSANRLEALDASQTILQALKVKRKTDTAQWLSGLEKEISDSNTAPPAAAVDQNTMIGQAINWLDRMFVEFELYAGQFNLNVKGTNLVVSCTRPIKRTNETDGLYAEAADDCLNYAGHIATQLWALVVRGCASKVEIFIIPAEFLLGFTVNSVSDTGYEPLLVIESAWQDKEIIWHVQENIITTDQISSLAKELFGDLIKVASGQISESELFSHPPLPNVAQNGLVQDQKNLMVNEVKSSTTLPSGAGAMPLKTGVKISATSLESIKVANQLLSLTDKDINSLMEIGKQALESNDNTSAEQVRSLTEKLGMLKQALMAALKDIGK